jgi:hypothetical protein
MARSTAARAQEHVRIAPWPQGLLRAIHVASVMSAMSPIYLQFRTYCGIASRRSLMGPILRFFGSALSGVFECLETRQGGRGGVPGGLSQMSRTRC